MKLTANVYPEVQQSEATSVSNTKFKVVLPSKNTIDFKLLVITWNMMGKLPSQKTLDILLTPQRTSADMIIFGSQECQTSLLMSFFCKSKDCWEKMLCDYLKARRFKMVQSHKLQGLHIIAFVKENKQQFITSLKSKKIKTGWYGFMGNKGAVSLSLTLAGQSFLFINVHLPSQHDDSCVRNDHLMQIIDKLVDKSKKQSIIFFGDMNYRLNVTGEESRSICALNEDKQLNYHQFACKDQLTQQKQLQFFLNIFRQENISFPPTYKLSTEDNTYNHNRITGWTDRIFYHPNDNCQIRQDEYYSDMYVMGSDHRPVLGVFSIKIDPQMTALQSSSKQKQNKKCLFF